MSKFYGQVFGSAETVASRRGHKNIRTTAQSYDGSVITELWYNKNDELMVVIELDDDSKTDGEVYFIGTFEKLKQILKGR